MWPDWISNPGPLALELDALQTALCDMANDNKLGHYQVIVILILT